MTRFQAQSLAREIAGAIEELVKAEAKRIAGEEARRIAKDMIAGRSVSSAGPSSFSQRNSLERAIEKALVSLVQDENKTESQ